MNVGIIGSGGREHAICYMLKKSKKVSKIFCFPGNAGTDLIAQNVNLDPDNFSEIFPLMKEEIQDLKKQIGENKKTYSWMLYECEDNNFCKDRLVRSFLNQLFSRYIKFF